MLDLPSIVKPVFRGVLQIGAHFGGEHAKFREIGCTNFCYIEPNPDSFRKLMEKVEPMKAEGETVDYFNKAIGPPGGPNLLYVERANGGQSCSLLKPKVHCIQYPQIVFDELPIEVSVVGLDDLLGLAVSSQMGFDRDALDLISIDIQGYELQALQTGLEQLKRTKAIVAELNRSELYEGCAMHATVVEFLESQGFELIRLNWAGVTWGDGLFVRKDAKEEILLED